ncbi:MAG TPA: M15 family metallopeptidase [Acidimicrobiales bacterium]|nr:M15 family metallopeptidase [Acidimicrobiales bacterium]
MRRSLLVALTAVLVAVGAPASAGPAVHPDNRPTPVPGRSNGQLHSTDLITVGPRCVAYRPAATSLHLLLAAARHEGVDLATSECYRPYDGQVEERAAWGPCAARPGTSMHGWGKAVDFRDRRGGLTFSSPAYAWLKANASHYGWNHPGWARPGGSGCDEAWHWEWVGDGGVMGGDPVRADIVAVMTKPGGGWWSVTGLGAVTAADGATGHGGAEGLPLQRLMVGGAPTPDGGGYRLVAGDGGVFTYGNASFLGSMGGKPLNQPIVGMASTNTGNGYWLVASDGGIFTFGDAAFLGSMGGTPLNKPVVGMAATPSGNGYWLVASDGGIFTFGDAGFAGSTGGQRLNKPVVGMAAAGPSAYWLVASDGGIFTFGGAPFRGSLGGQPTAPVAGMAPAGSGYRLVAVDGTVTSFS